MKYYCAGCGKELHSNAFNEGKLAYHFDCVPIPVEVPSKQERPSKTDRVNHINENRITSELRDLEATLNMINHPQPRLVRV